MIKFLILGFLISISTFAYVPTVESLFRHGSNPDLTTNAAMLTFAVRKADAHEERPSSDTSLLKETKNEDFYRLYFSKYKDDALKISQTRYEDKSFSETSLMEKKYYPNFTQNSIRANAEESEKAIFHGVLRSIIFNEGSYILESLKRLGVPVKLNREILNKAKVELLASYKQYLITINKDKDARKTLENPLSPKAADQRDYVNNLMKESMYVDQDNVKIAKDDSDLGWMVNAGDFEAVFNYQTRDLVRIKYKTELGELEIQCKDYFLSNGQHRLPKYIILKDYKGEVFQIELMNLRHFNERETDLVKRLAKWDEILKGKTSDAPKPSFVF